MSTLLPKRCKLLLPSELLAKMFVVMPFKWSCAPFGIWSLLCLQLFCPCFGRLQWWPPNWVGSAVSGFFFGVPLQSRVLNALPSSFSVVLFGDKLQCQISMRTAGFGPFERRSWCNAKRVRMGNCVWMASVSQDEEKVAEVTESTAKCLSLDTR